MLLDYDAKTVVPALAYIVRFMFFIFCGLVMVSQGWLIPRGHHSLPASSLSPRCSRPAPDVLFTLCVGLQTWKLPLPWNTAYWRSTERSDVQGVTLLSVSSIQALGRGKMPSSSLSSGTEKIPGSPALSNTGRSRGDDMKHDFDMFHVLCPAR